LSSHARSFYDTGLKILLAMSRDESLKKREAFSGGLPARKKKTGAFNEIENLLRNLFRFFPSWDLLRGLAVK
jgi:hypothetical protein